MSQGSPIVTLRLPPELLAMIDEYVEKSADKRREEPWTRSSFILSAVIDKLRKMNRSAGREQFQVPEQFARDQFAW